MAISQMSEVIRHLRRTVLLRDGAALTDGQLLADYLSRRDEAALAALVRRHGPMVWGVCRRVLRNHHDAEDAFQATFLVLVRKAASIASRELLANWLYGVAHQTALKARATAAKRRTRERQVAEMPEPEVVQQDLWHDLQPLLDQELSRLPDKYRVVIVLCDLEGKTRKEAARQLGCPEGTVGGWLARARVMLAKRLAQRGVALSGGALAAVLSQNVALAGVPPSVGSGTIKAASLFAAGKAAATGVISAQVAALAEGVLKTMLLTKLKIATAAVLVAVLTCTIVGLRAYPLTAAEPTEPRQIAQGEGKADAPKKDTPKGDAAREAEEEKEKEAAKLKGKWRAVAAETAGNVLPEATAKTNVWDIADGKITRKLPANDPKGGKEEEVVPFRIDPTKKPAHIDLEVEVAGIKGVMKGIYKLDGDELTVCLYGADGGRPTEFTSSDLGNGQKGGNILMKFKREKEDKEKKEEK
jgi:RNA polymerase sigma factor (sigma-70 family)